MTCLVSLYVFPTMCDRNMEVTLRLRAEVHSLTSFLALSLSSFLALSLTHPFLLFLSRLARTVYDFAVC